MRKNSVNKKDSSAKRTTEVDSARRMTNSSKRRKNSKNLKSKEKEIVIERSSGRSEKFDSNRMAQTVSRSGSHF